MGRILFLAILIGVGLLASSLPSGATATTLDTASLGNPDLSTPVVPGQPEGDDDKDNDDNGDENGGRVETINDKFAKVAKKHPEFGGMFIDPEKNTLNVFLLDGGDLDAVVEELKKVFGEETLPQEKAKALKAKYSFLQLKEWFEILVPRLSQVPGVSMVDIDDSKNRLLVGVENQEARNDVKKQLKELDIPAQAVNIIKVGPLKEFDSLRDHHRPLRGGLLINRPGTFQGRPAEFGCTLGFMAIRQGVRGFVTNAHCSPTRGVDEGTVFYQPVVELQGSEVEDDNQIGVEDIDPPFSPPCTSVEASLTSTVDCRSSDSLFARLQVGTEAGPDEEPPPELTVRQGFIARPTVINRLPFARCTSDPRFDPPNAAIDPTFCAWDGVSTFRITGEGSLPPGQGNITKVGARTGRTQGFVVFSGVAKFVDEGLLEDQVLAALPAAEGDSGAPVFRASFPDPNQTTVNTELLGILWGGDFLIPTLRVGPLTIISPISGVEADLGALDTCAPSVPC